MNLTWITGRRKQPSSPNIQFWTSLTYKEKGTTTRSWNFNQSLHFCFPGIWPRYLINSTWNIAVTTILSRHPLIASLYSFCFRITKNRKILLRQPKSIKRRKKRMIGTNMLELWEIKTWMNYQCRDMHWSWIFIKVIHIKWS